VAEANHLWHGQRGLEGEGIAGRRETGSPIFLLDSQAAVYARHTRNAQSAVRFPCDLTLTPRATASTKPPEQMLLGG
jgi:hypothetical protein